MFDLEFRGVPTTVRMTAEKQIESAVRRQMHALKRINISSADRQSEIEGCARDINSVIIVASSFRSATRKSVKKG